MDKVRVCNFVNYLDLKITSIEKGKAEATIEVKNEYKQQLDIAHGGFLATLCDSVACFAAMSMLPADKNVVTVDLNISFLRPAKGKILKAVGGVVKAGKNIFFSEARIYDNDVLVSKASATVMVVQNVDID